MFFQFFFCFIFFYAWDDKAQLWQLLLWCCDKWVKMMCLWGTICFVFVFLLLFFVYCLCWTIQSYILNCCHPFLSFVCKTENWKFNKTCLGRKISLRLSDASSPVWFRYRATYCSCQELWDRGAEGPMREQLSPVSDRNFELLMSDTAFCFPLDWTSPLTASSICFNCSEWNSLWLYALTFNVDCRLFHVYILYYSFFEKGALIFSYSMMFSLKLK